jgi:hypothetical protein
MKVTPIRAALPMVKPVQKPKREEWLKRPEKTTASSSKFSFAGGQLAFICLFPAFNLAGYLH